jgi:hypothetical protein
MEEIAKESTTREFELKWERFLIDYEMERHQVIHQLMDAAELSKKKKKGKKGKKKKK